VIKYCYYFLPRIYLNKVPHEFFLSLTVYNRNNYPVNGLDCWDRTRVVYGHGQTRIWGGGARWWCYRKSRDRKWRDRKWPWPEVTLTGSHVTESAPTGNMLCACATGSCAISALVGPFHRKWRHKSSRDPLGFPWKGGVRACATGSCTISTLVGPFLFRVRACATVSRVFSYSSSSTVVQVPWIPVTEGHLTPSGIPLGVRMRNRNLRTFHRKLTTDIDVIFPRSSAKGWVCSLRRPRPIFSMVTGTSPGYLPFPAILFSFHWLSTLFLFSYNIYVV